MKRDETLLAKGGFATQQTVDNEQAQVDAPEATIAGDAAAIESAQINLDYATIKAPFTGVVGLRNVDIGNVVSPGSNILTLARDRTNRGGLHPPQADLTRFRSRAQGKRAGVSASIRTATTLLRAPASSRCVNNQVDPATGTIKLKARFDNKDRKLWPGAFVQVRVVAKPNRTPSSCHRRRSSTVPTGPMSGDVARPIPRGSQPVEIEAIQDDRTVIAKRTSGRRSHRRRRAVSPRRRRRVSESDPAQVAQPQGSQP